MLKTFSQADTLTTSLQDWRKGRRAEVQEVNGWVVDILRVHGQEAPVNLRVMNVAFDIETGRIDARPENAALLIEAYQAVMAHG